MENVVELIAKSHGQAEADAYRLFTRSPKHAEVLKKAAYDSMLLFPKLAGSCVMMSVVFLTRLKHLHDGPYHVVAGSLKIDGSPVFGMDADNYDWSAAFTGENLSWDGHCWIVCGDLIADVSLLRTANSPKSPPALARKARHSFGTSTGMIAFTASQAAGIGMEYRAYHVLTNPEIDGLLLGCQALIPAAE